MILRSASASWPAGIITAVREFEYSSGDAHRISRPQARTARRVLSPWRAGRSGGRSRGPHSPTAAVGRLLIGKEDGAAARALHLLVKDAADAQIYPVSLHGAPPAS